MKTPFVEHEGQVYIAIQASGMHPLIPYIDGLSVALFPKFKKACIRLDDAIAWHEKELEQSHGTSGSNKTLGLLKQARERLAASA